MGQLSNIAGSLWWMIVTLGLLVTFHEFGHFVVARACGVKVLRFSVGFGRALWSRTSKSGTEYMVAMIPLGGYVKMLDAREGDVPAEESAQEFTGKPVWQRIAIVLAGPVFNLIFAVAVFWAMLVIGKPDYQPLIGQTTGLAAEAGLHRGDRILSVGDRKIANWTDLGLALADAGQSHKATPLRVRTPEGVTQTHVLHFEKLPPKLGEGALIERTGLSPEQQAIPPVIGKLEPGSGVSAAGLKPGDRVLSINGMPISDWRDLSDAVHAQARADRPLAVRLQRDGRTLELDVQPHQTTLPDGTREFAIGVYPQPVQVRYDTIQRQGPLAAIPAAFGQTWDLTARTVAMLGQMVTGSASLKNISGPISIAQYANDSAEMGPAWFLYFLGIVSLSLGIMNLLPIPILDGGHLLYYVIELVKGSPLSERAMMAGQYVGMALLMGLMSLAFYNDILRVASS
ncbi:MAG TPA: RIP metalloprotease RseP [Rhodanobacteraceae bacterium]|nr:RIP metalloprotease RseP [Rhodanobacteraceae bacterium]